MNYKSEIHPSLFHTAKRAKNKTFVGEGATLYKFIKRACPRGMKGKIIFSTFSKPGKPLHVHCTCTCEGLIGRLLRGHICRKEVPFLFFFFYLSGVSLSQGGDAYKASLVLCQGGGEGLAKKREKKRGKKKPCPSFSTLTPHTIAAGVILHAC